MKTVAAALIDPKAPVITKIPIQMCIDESSDILLFQNYRVNHHFADLGWIDFDSYAPPTLTTCSSSAHSAKISSARAESGREWNSQNQSHPNPGPRGDSSPCILFLTDSQLTHQCGPRDVEVWVDEPAAVRDHGHPLHGPRRQTHRVPLLLHNLLDDIVLHRWVRYE